MPNIRLAQELPKLLRDRNRIFCVLKNFDRIDQQFVNTGVHALGCALDPKAISEKSSIASMAQLSKAARKVGADAFVLRAIQRVWFSTAWTQARDILKDRPCKPPLRIQSTVWHMNWRIYIGIEAQSLCNGTVSHMGSNI